jgi:hypothetical protein
MERFIGSVPIHVDLPIAATVHERALSYRSFLQAQFHLRLCDVPLLHSFLAMALSWDHDPATVPRQFLNHARGGWRRHGQRNDRGIGVILAIPYQN